MGNLKLLLIFQPWLFPFWSFLAFHYFSLLLQLSMLMLLKGDVVLLVRKTHTVQIHFNFNELLIRVFQNYWILVIHWSWKPLANNFYYFGDIIDLLNTKKKTAIFIVLKWSNDFIWKPLLFNFVVYNVYQRVLLIWFWPDFPSAKSFQYSAHLFTVWKHAHITTYTIFLLFYTLKTTYKIHHFLSYSSCCKYHMQSCFAQESIAKPLMPL